MTLAPYNMNESLWRIARSRCAAAISVLVEAGRNCVGVAADRAVVCVSTYSLILRACACGRARARVVRIRGVGRIARVCNRAGSFSAADQKDRYKQQR